MRAYVERHISELGTPVIRAWSFEPSSWGTVGTGHDSESAAEDLRRWTGWDRVEIAEDIDGHDIAFSRDLHAATPGERTLSVAIARMERQRTLALLRETEPWNLGRPVSDAGVAGEALRIADLRVTTTADLLRRLIALESVEDRRSLGLAGQASGMAGDPVDEVPETVEAMTRALTESHLAAATAARHLPPRLIRAAPTVGEWSSVKLLRLLAWRERALGGLLAALLAPR